MSKLTLPIVIAIAVSLHASRPAAAQTFPTRPITLIVPVAPGGGADILSRVIADGMTKVLGQPVIVENRPGGNATVATRQVARSKPDGYFVGVGMSAALAAAPTSVSNIGYDPRTDFSPIGLIALSPLIVLVNPSLPVQSLQELIALAEKEPGKLTYASAGAGGPTHLGAVLLGSMTGIKMNHIPYKGTGPAITDLLGGHVSMAFTSLPPAVGLVRDGRVRALAVTTATRSRIFPDIPTIAESGLPGYELAPRYGIIAPAGTPRVIVEKLNFALREALASNEVKARIAAEGAEVLSSTPEEYAADIDREEAKWSKVVKQAGI
jgi:tripartite-type tricarboxylate transporter receptor subunit TctC